VEAKGQLKRDHEDTRCTARIRIAPRFYIIGLTLSAFVVFMVASPLHSLKGLLLCGLLILAVLGVSYWSAQRQCYVLARRIQLALHNTPPSYWQSRRLSG
jgi:hypothetical protein